jgi:hypothetical protein
MKVLNLQCSHQHAFEGWFGSEEDFQNQLARGLVTCPLCSDPVVRKMPSAPRLNLGAAAEEPTATSPSRELALPAAPATHSPAHAMMRPDIGNPAVQAEFLKALRHVLAHTENVGERFADEARAMHYGDAEQRSIRGQTSREEAIELLEEGIDVMPLPLADAIKETLQ